jgi:hypothetical protein
MTAAERRATLTAPSSLATYDESGGFFDHVVSHESAVRRVVQASPESQRAPVYGSPRERWLKLERVGAQHSDKSRTLSLGQRLIEP